MYGGISEAAGLYIAYNDMTVLGFGISGQTIQASGMDSFDEESTLLVLELSEGEDVGVRLQGIIVSSVVGKDLGFLNQSECCYGPDCCSGSTAAEIGAIVQSCHAESVCVCEGVDMVCPQ